MWKSAMCLALRVLYLRIMTITVIIIIRRIDPPAPSAIYKTCCSKDQKLFIFA